jgi:hypothetical protein
MNTQDLISMNTQEDFLRFLSISKLKTTISNYRAIAHQEFLPMSSAGHQAGWGAHPPPVKPVKIENLKVILTG